MMVGDLSDIMRRIKALLPGGWFSEDSPVLDSVTAGLGETWSWIYRWVQFAQSQCRIAAASEIWLDLIANDYFGASIKRRQRETDDHFRSRIQQNLLRERGTRGALTRALTDLTGRQPNIFEPAFCHDTGGYGAHPDTVGGLAYGVAGGWGSLALPFQCFVTAYRPHGAGIAAVSGWRESGGGYGCGTLEYANLGLMEDIISDADILATVAGVLPAATIAWARVTD